VDVTKVKKKAKKEKPPPNLVKILKLLEAANSSPSKSTDYLKDLSTAVEKMIEKIDQVEISFAEGSEKHIYEEQIESFM